MPSRKRNQGRARKAKAAGGAPPTREPRPQPREGGCRHGCTLPPGHVCNAFVQACYDEWDKAAAGTNMVVAIQDSINLALKTRPIKESDFYQAKSCFVEDGVNIILRGGFNTGTRKAFCMIAAAVQFFEGIHGRNTAKEMLKVNDILFGCKRTAIRFFSKRIPCSCLDDLYSEAKETLTKMGGCRNCGQVKEHSALMECSRCKSVQYCSKECQLTHWPSHKEVCDSRRRYEKEQKEG